jgi:hypothetical protein
MFNGIKQSAIAAIGAIILSSTAISAAVGPARVVETTPVAYVDAQTDTVLRG